LSETRSQLDAFAPDIVHISTPDIIGRKFLLYARERSLPVASAYHTDFPSYLAYYRLGFAAPALWRYLVWFYNSCNTVLAPNEIVREKLLEKGIRTVGIWSRGIDRDLFNPARRSLALRKEWRAEGRTVFVFAGRFVWYKDIRVVMDLYERFIREGLGDRVRFVMIGSGPEEDELRSHMPEAVFTGYLTGSELPRAYASGDIFFFPPLPKRSAMWLLRLFHPVCSRWCLILAAAGILLSFRVGVLLPVPGMWMTFLTGAVNCLIRLILWNDRGKKGLPMLNGSRGRL